MPRPLGLEVHALLIYECTRERAFHLFMCVLFRPKHVLFALLAHFNAKALHHFTAHIAVNNNNNNNNNNSDSEIEYRANSAHMSEHVTNAHTDTQIH